MSKDLKTQKSRLGRGLSSLMSMSDLPVQAEVPQQTERTQPSERNEPNSDGALSPYRQLPIDQVRPNPKQPRRQIDEAKLTELAASLKSTGIIQPVVVRQVPGGYELVAGERRWRAAQLAGLTTLPAIVREIDAFEQAQMALVENIQREDLNPIDRATSYRELMAALGLSHSELAARLGEDRSSVSNYLRILDLDDAVQEHVRGGAISMGHAKLLAGVSDKARQLSLAETVIGQQLSVRNLERIIANDGAAAPDNRPTSSASAHVRDLEKTIARELGMRVQVREGRKKGKGKLVIHYADLDQFDTLLGKLGVKID